MMNEKFLLSQIFSLGASYHIATQHKWKTSQVWRLHLKAYFNIVPVRLPFLKVNNMTAD